jgi:hypothetical protein
MARPHRRQRPAPRPEAPPSRASAVISQAMVRQAERDAAPDDAPLVGIEGALAARRAAAEHAASAVPTDTKVT